MPNRLPYSIHWVWRHKCACLIVVDPVTASNKSGRVEEFVGPLDELRSQIRSTQLDCLT